MRLSVRDALSRRTVKDLLHVRGIEVSHETLRVWGRRSGRLVAAEIRWTRRARLRSLPRWLWHLDTAFVKINGATPCSVAHDGDALKSLAKTMKRHGNPHAFVTDTFRSCGAAVTDLGRLDGRETCRWRKNPPRTSRDRFRRMRSLQKDVAVPSRIRTLFPAKCALTGRANKASRAAALAKGRQRCAAGHWAGLGQQRLGRTCYTAPAQGSS